MKRQEVVVLWVVVGLLVLMCLFPPWQDRSSPAGYHVIFWYRSESYKQRIDFERLGLQCVALIGLGAGLILAPRMWPKP